MSVVRMTTQARNLKLPLSKFSVACLDTASHGMHFVKCFVLRTREDIVTDHLLVRGKKSRYWTRDSSNVRRHAVPL